MAFYAYSPLAGGLLAKSMSEARAGYRTAMLTDLGVVPEDDTVADEAAQQRRQMFAQGMSRLEHSVETSAAGPDGLRLELKDAALRWFFHHSQLIEGDAVVVGSSRLDQVEQLLTSLSLPTPLSPQDPLPTSVVGALDNLWDSLRGMPYYPNQLGAPSLARIEQHQQLAAIARL
jgi:aflatoxin B1 aldehyde reductase